jgi:conflict system STAND superfamily ATPase/D-alanyl-D-alanine carboxypeptidase-like protein
MADSQTPSNPYVGPVPFGPEHKDLFFGRDYEAKLLYARAVAERVVLFYAESGTGKTSLINTRLIPSLSQRYQVLPMVRVGRDLPAKFDYEDIYNIYTFNTLVSLGGPKVKPEELTVKPLISLMQDKLVDIDFERPHWLIFDQFEEIVTTHLVQRDKRADFFDQLRELLEKDRFLSLVLAVREDYLADIYDYAPHMPGRLEVRLRMTALSTKAATDAVILPAEKAGRKFSREAAKLIVEDLSQLRVADMEDPIIGDRVEPLNLQIVCFTFWERLNAVARTGEETSPITEEHVKKYAKVDEVLENYYDAVLKSVTENAKVVTEAELRRWIGDTLITPSGIRAQVNRGFLKTGNLPNKVVDLLHEAHLLRVEEVRGGKWYELSHDRFIAPILQSNAKWAAPEGESPLALAAKLWIKNNHDESYLLRGQALQAAQENYLPEIANLTQAERDYLTASINGASNRTRKNYTVLTGVIIATLYLAGFGLYQMWKSNARNRAYELKNKEYELKNLEYEQERDQFQKQKAITAQLLKDLGVTSEYPLQPLPSPSPSPSVDSAGPTFTTNSSVVGEVHWRLSTDGTVEYLDNWDQNNIMTVDIPQLQNIQGANGGKVQFNRLAANQLKEAWAEVETQGLLNRVVSWQGSFARKAIGTRLSSHALGLAFDINIEANQTGVVPALQGDPGSVRELVPIFQKHGFTWGGNWTVPDGGHLEVTKLVK